MKYFSGFCFKNEQSLFDKYLVYSDFNIAGFSKGAIKALEYTYQNPHIRIDKLVLLSPAYFNDKDNKFIRTQLMYFKKNSQLYIKNFLSNTIYPSNIDISEYIIEDSIDELEFLLKYKFSSDKLKSIVKNGTEIEVYLGDKDKIISYQQVYNFFIKFATIYTIKNSGHILS